MANAFFTLGLQHWGDGDIDWSADNTKVIGVDHADDTPVLSTDEASDDIDTGAKVFTSGNLAGKTNVGGVMDATDLTIATVSGDPFESIVMYKDSGTPATNWLMAYWDTLTGLPFTPAGTDVIIIWDNGANKIFSG